MAIIRTKPGVAVAQDGTYPELRGARKGGLVSQDVGSRFEEACYRGVLFSTGTSVAALTAATILLTSAAQPILGVWNPLNSPVNVVILQAAVQAYINTFTTPVGLGSFVWASSVGNNNLTAGLNPFCRKTLANQGSQAKAFNVGTASLLTGLTNNLVIFEGAGELLSPTGQTYGTIVAPTAGTSLTSFGGVANIDGSIIVPPGGVLALLNTTSTTTMSVEGRLMWEEIPL
jgi:hypothetical protein